MTKIKNKFSFVMPMVINHRSTEDNDLERILKIQLPTFKKYLNLNDLHKFYIITRSSDISTIKQSLIKDGGINEKDFKKEFEPCIKRLNQRKKICEKLVKVKPSLFSILKKAHK